MPVVTLIDASGFIFRAYHAIQHLSTSKGVPTNAVYGFTRMLLKTLRELDPTHVALAFDKESRAGRQAIDPTYKANREPPPDDLVPQFALIRKVVETLDVPVLEYQGWEADDVIGTLADRAKAEGFDVYVITGDKDFIQIVDEHLELFDPMLDKKTTPADVQERLGIKPSQMRDYLALIGDAIDNVPKVPGIGPKTAVELIQQFGDVETLLSRVGEVAKPKLREALSTNADQLRRAKQLVTFRRDLPLEVKIGDLKRRPIHEAEARALFTELEFYKLLQEMPATQVSLAANTRPLLKVEELQELAKEISEARVFSVIPAFEGSPLTAELVGLAFATAGGRTRYVPLRHRYVGAPDQIPLRAVKEVLGPLFADPKLPKRGHGLKTLWHVLAANGITLDGMDEDVELASYLLNPSRKEHTLTDLARERLRSELPLLTAPGKKGARVSELTVEEAGHLFGAWADAAYQMAGELWKELEGVGLGKLGREIEIPLMPVLARMEREGVRIDSGVLARINERVEADCKGYLAEIYKLAGHEFNVNSNAQMNQVLYEEIKLPVLKRGKTGPSTDHDVLEKLAEQHPLPGVVLKYRDIAKLKSTYLDPLPALVAADGRIHTTFHQAAAATGRLSSTDPNLQNVPIRSDTGQEIRGAFVADPEQQLISADYSQIELRLLAHVSSDAVLIESFQHDEDVHTRTASEVFGVKPEEVTANQRRAAKMVNYGIAYGLSPHGLSTRLDIPHEEAKSIIDRYFARYTGIRRYLEETIEKARKSGYVETMFGRRRYVPEVHAKSRWLAEAAEREAINMPIQGTAADLIKIAMIQLDRRIPEEKLGARMLLQVHDELLFEAPKAEVERVVALAKECMSGVAQLKVPLVVDVGTGTTWADAH
jgi:DNA polymerase-1